jgi:hypothetical protein
MREALGAARERLAREIDTKLTFPAWEKNSALSPPRFVRLRLPKCAVVRKFKLSEYLQMSAHRRGWVA